MSPDLVETTRWKAPKVRKQLILNVQTGNELGGQVTGADTRRTLAEADQRFGNAADIVLQGHAPQQVDVLVVKPETITAQRQRFGHIKGDGGMAYRQQEA